MGTERQGMLRIVSTPIGNLKDITLRALEALIKADLIAAEDTRAARVLLSAHDIPAPRLISLFEGNETRRVNERLRQAEAELRRRDDAAIPSLKPDPETGIYRPQNGRRDD